MSSDDIECLGRDYGYGVLLVVDNGEVANNLPGELILSGAQVPATQEHRRLRSHIVPVIRIQELNPASDSELEARGLPRDEIMILMRHDRDRSGSEVQKHICQRLQTVIRSVAIRFVVFEFS
nr:hypothetical protein [Rhodopirellula sp. SM50]